MMEQGDERESGQIHFIGFSLLSTFLSSFSLADSVGPVNPASVHADGMAKEQQSAALSHPVIEAPRANCSHRIA